MSTEEEALAFSDVGVHFENPEVDALRGVRFAQSRGELTAVLGASGAGKSTLLKCANRTVPELQRAEMRGDVRVFGRSTKDVRVGELAEQVGFVFQDFEAQLFSTSVLEEVIFGLEQLGVPAEAMKERMRWALGAVGLSGFERRDPTSLSGGEKQRLAIAAVLALRPGLLLLDEPSTDLDPAGRRKIFEVLGSLRDSGAALLVAEHDVEAVADADRFVVLSEGSVVIEGPPATVFAESERLAAMGVRPPELATLCARLGLPAWPLDLDSVEARLRAAGIRPRHRSGAFAGAAGGPPILEARGLRYRYPDAEREALRGVDLTLRAGEFVAIVGSNGSGKSTLARHLNGLLTATHGSVVWRGKEISKLGAGERARAVGYVFQNPDEQIFAATVEEEVAFGPVHLGYPPEKVSRRVREAIDAVDLAGLEHRDPFLLGKGERQKVAVASILALEPEVLVLDEPTTGLDFRETLALMRALERLNRRGQAVVIITHVPWVVSAYARRAVLVADGEILWDGGVRDLFEREDLCLRGDFVPTDVTCIGRRFGVTPLIVEELLEWCA